MLKQYWPTGSSGVKVANQRCPTFYLCQVTYHSPRFQELGCGCFAGMLPTLFMEITCDLFLAQTQSWVHHLHITRDSFWPRLTYDLVNLIEPTASWQFWMHSHLVSQGQVLHLYWANSTPGIVTQQAYISTADGMALLQSPKRSLYCASSIWACHKLHLISFPTSDTSNTTGSPRLHCTSSSTVSTIGRIFFRLFPNLGLI